MIEIKIDCSYNDRVLSDLLISFVNVNIPKIEYTFAVINFYKDIRYLLLSFIIIIYLILSMP